MRCLRVDRSVINYIILSAKFLVRLPGCRTFNQRCIPSSRGTFLSYVVIVLPCFCLHNNSTSVLCKLQTIDLVWALARCESLLSSTQCLPKPGPFSGEYTTENVFVHRRVPPELIMQDVIVLQVSPRTAVWASTVVSSTTSSDTHQQRPWLDSPAVAHTYTQGYTHFSPGACLSYLFAFVS